MKLKIIESGDIMNVAPSILAANFCCLNEEINKVNASCVKYLHLDIMDGHFVPNISFGPSIVKQIRPLTNALFDVHLMIENPEKYLDAFIDAGADRITYHYEVNLDHHQMLDLIHQKGLKAGLSIKPKTVVTELIPYLAKVDLVLVMSVEPGFGGQKFMMDALEKIQFLDNYRKQNNLKYQIEVDGGINLETAKLVKEAGADIIVAGTYLFKEKSMKEKVAELEKL